MAAIVIDGNAIAAAVRREWKGRAEALKRRGVLPFNRAPDGRLVGDVDFDAVQENAGYITPVPGGVGPMTIAMLVANTVLAAERHAAARRRVGQNVNLSQNPRNFPALIRP